MAPRDRPRAPEKHLLLNVMVFMATSFLRTGAIEIQTAARHNVGTLTMFERGEQSAELGRG